MTDQNCPCLGTCCEASDIYQWPDNYCECRVCGKACDCLMEGIPK